MCSRKEKMCSVVTLAISETRAQDAGRYECQVCALLHCTLLNYYVR